MKLDVVKEKVQNLLKAFECISKKQVLADQFIKAYHPVCSENAQSTWVYGIAYDFRTTKTQKKYHFKMEKCIIVVSLAALIVVTMGQFYALIYDEIGKKEEKYELKF
jgi:hypothetical protein